MSSLDLVSGDFGTGRAEYESGILSLPDQLQIAVEDIVAVGQQGTVSEGTVLGAIAGGFKGAAALGPIGVLVGVVGAPAVVPAAITAMIVGGAFGLLHGSRKDRAIIHVGLRDGRALAALCDADFPALIARDVEVAKQIAARRPTVMIDVTPKRSSWAGHSQAPKTSAEADRPVLEHQTDRMPDATPPALYESAVATAGEALKATGAAAGHVADTASSLATSAIASVRNLLGR